MTNLSRFHIYSILLLVITPTIAFAATDQVQPLRKQFDSNTEMILYITDLCDRGRIDECFSYYREDYRYHRPTGSGVGRDSSGFKKIAAAMSDMETGIIEVIEEGDRLGIRWYLEGTHTEGPIYGIQPRGKRARLVVNQIMHLENGKAAAGWEEFDMLGFIRQLGATIIIDGKPINEVLDF